MANLTDYQNDLRKIERNIAEIGSPSDTDRATRRAYGLYQHAALTGRIDEFTAAEAAIAEAFDKVGSCPFLCLVKSNLYIKFHRLQCAKRFFFNDPAPTESFAGRTVWA